MLFPIDVLFAFITQYITLLPGDLILTGTPAGVGPLNPGDEIQASITRIASIQTRVI
jgi:2-keto-4-pentenoate hydratase/2-oxohepta-3-ene-1,7-dioic acid hydratase in catechol pathway